jgi:hypothetical protein
MTIEFDWYEIVQTLGTILTIAFLIYQTNRTSLFYCSNSVVRDPFFQSDDSR